jgi:hypothetical protein
MNVIGGVRGVARRTTLRESRAVAIQAIPEWQTSRA